MQRTTTFEVRSRSHRERRLFVERVAASAAGSTEVAVGGSRLQADGSARSRANTTEKGPYGGPCLQWDDHRWRRKTALYRYAREGRIPEEFTDFDFETLGSRAERRSTPDNDRVEAEV